MANIFPKSFNILPLQIAVCLGIAGISVAGAVTYYFTPKYTRVGYQPTQPVPFSHAIHAGQLGMDCRYCHSFVDISNHSNVPTTQTCMACHSQIQQNSPRLALVRDNYASGKPIEWVRIHQAPDYVYFNHAVHVNRGVSCVSCHGKVNEMEVVWHDQPQSMGWCLECHRAPENHLRPLQQVYNLNWTPPEGKTQQQIGQELKEAWQVKPPVTCAGCHR